MFINLTMYGAKGSSREKTILNSGSTDLSDWKPGLQVVKCWLQPTKQSCYIDYASCKYLGDFSCFSPFSVLKQLVLGVCRGKADSVGIRTINEGPKLMS